MLSIKESREAHNGQLRQACGFQLLHGLKAVRISLDEDRRVFMPLARSSLKWERCYDRRTAVERVNSRLDVSFGFEKHTIRGLTKMNTRCTLALAVMLAMAMGQIKANQSEAMRSLLKAA